MFKKYNVNDLYKATIDVVYQDCYDTIESHYLLISHDYKGGYSYNTILFKTKKGYIDFNNPRVKLFDSGDLIISNGIHETIYKARDIEPLANYYNQDEVIKGTVNKCKVKKIKK